MNMTPVKRACLLLDNPLRDLDGIVLLAYRLASKGVCSYIVPMNVQGFDVPALRADVVLANYVRWNNLDLLKIYRSNGLRIAILDTEGTGDWWGDVAKWMADVNTSGFIDSYCCWSNDPRDHMLRAGAFPDDKLHVTGCPRYDFIAPSLRQVLPPPNVPGGYVLVNTNFPIINPRFAAGTSDESQTWVAAGRDEDYVKRYATAARTAHLGIKKALRILAQRRGDFRFVIRPHPFERIEAYEDLLDLPNVTVRQDGTSLQWLNHAKALLHLNCSTALEASLMGVEAITFEWLNNEVLLVSDPQRVSRQAKTIDEIELWLDRLFDQDSLETLAERESLVKDVIARNYHKLDGLAAERVASLLVKLAQQESVKRLTTGMRIGLRQRAVSLARKILGFRYALKMKALSPKGRHLCQQRLQKLPKLEAVNDLIARIACVEGFQPSACWAAKEDYSDPRQASGSVIRIG